MESAKQIPEGSPANTHDDIESLEHATRAFFDRHWGCADAAPCWSHGWRLCGPVPNYLLGGVYAIFRDHHLLYVGLGASLGGGIYKDRGISRRLYAHVVRVATDGSSYLFRERWIEAGATSVSTLGFEQDTNYLAPALEDYLIRSLSPTPPCNVMKRPKKQSPA